MRAQRGQIRTAEPEMRLAQTWMDLKHGLRAISVAEDGGHPGGSVYLVGDHVEQLVFVLFMGRGPFFEGAMPVDGMWGGPTTWTGTWWVRGNWWDG